MQAVIQIINTIKWPFVVIVTLIIFRKPVSELISYIKAIRWGNFEATFGRKIKQLEKDAKDLPCSINIRVSDEIKVANTGKVEKVLPFDTSDRYAQLAKIDPRSAIIDAWRDLELTIVDEAREFNIPEKYNTRKIVDALSNRGILEPAEKNLFEQLYKLRNQAIHARQFDVSFVDSLTYCHAAKMLANCIKTKNNKQFQF